jgi:hypothetical protein
MPWSGPIGSTPERSLAGTDDSNQSSGGIPTLPFPGTARAAVESAGSAGKSDAQSWPETPPRSAPDTPVGAVPGVASKPASKDSAAPRRATSTARRGPRRRFTPSFHKDARSERLTDMLNAPESLPTRRYLPVRRPGAAVQVRYSPSLWDLTKAVLNIYRPLFWTIPPVEGPGPILRAFWKGEIAPTS